MNEVKNIVGAQVTSRGAATLIGEMRGALKRQNKSQTEPDQSQSSGSDLAFRDLKDLNSSRHVPVRAPRWRAALGPLRG